MSLFCDPHMLARELDLPCLEICAERGLQCKVCAPFILGPALHTQESWQQLIREQEEHYMKMTKLKMVSMISY